MDFETLIFVLIGFILGFPVGAWVWEWLRKINVINIKIGRTK